MTNWGSIQDCSDCATQEYADLMNASEIMYDWDSGDDEQDSVVIFKHKDGRYILVSQSADYTGHG